MAADGQAASPQATPTSSPAMAQELNTATIGAIVGVAAAMLATLIALIWCLVRQRQLHQRGMADLERRANVIRDRNSGLAQVAQMEGVPVTRPRNVLRRATFLPFGTRVGWDTLESREDVSRQQAQDANMPTSIYTRPARNKKRESKRLSWPFSRQPVLPTVIPMEDMGQHPRLSTVVESPSGSASLQSHPATREVNDALRASGSGPSAGDHRVRTIRRIDSVSELRPDPLIVGKKRTRAQTMVNSSTFATPRTEPSKVKKRPRPAMHVRSFSLGSQSPGSVPQHAVPPLPLTVRNVEIASRPKSCYSGNATSRVSISSLESIGSSLLASPRLQRSGSERSARLQHVARRDYANSLITGPRPQRPRVNKRPQSSPEHNLYLQSLRGSIKSNVDSMRSEGQRPLSTITTASDVDALSIPSVKTAEAVRLSRISFATSGTPYQCNSTPRRQSRITVSENGSPAQRVRPVALREIPANARLSRQLSQTSTDASSTRSSNGNPFQFDPSPMASGKPSAMKGSPTARGNSRHRRSQVVRINISPQVIGPKRGSSPLMADIQEESPETMTKMPLFSSSMGPLPNPPSSPRPPSTSTFDPQLKVRPSSFIASLTADSPALSSMSFMQDYKRSSTASSNGDRDTNRLSFSSIFIPSFPSPGKAALTTNVMPTPTFSYTRPSNELERESPSTEAMMLLARPYSPREQDDFKLSVTSAERNARKVSQGSTTGELIFPTLEKEQLRAAKPRFDDFAMLDVDLAASPASSPDTSPDASPTSGFAPQNWDHESVGAEALPPMSPPLSPKSASPSALQAENKIEAKGALDAGQRQDITLPLHSPAPIPGLNICHSPLLPSSQVDPPATDLCLSIAQLRRMNSDAKHDAQNPKLKAARRYQRMGRSESPRVVSRDSVESLFEIDEALDFGIGTPDETADDDSIIYGSSPDVDAGKENVPTVWEDGEDYWKPKPRSKSVKTMPSSPLLPSSRDVSPLAASDVQNRDNKGIQSPLVHRRVSEMRGSAILEKLPLALSGINGPGTPKVVIQPPSSEMGSPAASSLYDADGFLR